MTHLFGNRTRLLLLAVLVTVAASCGAPHERFARPAVPELYEPDFPPQVDPPVVRLSDGERSIVLIGTIHSVPAEYSDRLLDLSPELYEHIDTADSVLVESDLVTIDPIQRVIVTMEVTRAHEEPDREDGRPSLEEKIENRSDRNGDISSRIASSFDEAERREIEEIAQLRPWAARRRINDLFRDESEVEWESGLDNHIAERARRSGVDLDHLEQWEELAELQDNADQEPYVRAILFTLEADVDRDLMMRTRSNHELALVERWSRSDLTGSETTIYEDLNVDVPESVLEAWSDYDSIIFEARERIWADRILDRIERDEVDRMVVAVGASHLVDDRAILLELLAEAGFEERAR